MSQPTIADVERELVECQQECGRLIGQLREARAQAYEEIARTIEEYTSFRKKAGVAELLMLRDWIRRQSKRIRESK